MQIPRVDLSLPEAEAAQQLHRACSEAGIFYVCNHGVPDALVEAMFDQVRAAFALPLEVKQAMTVDRHNRGWTPFESQTLDPDGQTKPDTKEGFYFGRDEEPAASPRPAADSTAEQQQQQQHGDCGTHDGAAASHTQQHQHAPDSSSRTPQGPSQDGSAGAPAPSRQSSGPLHGPNRWPPEELVPGLRPTVNAYYEALTALGARLLRLLGLALGLEPEFFGATYFATTCSVLRLLRYSAEVSRPSGGVFAAGAHTDFGLLTILATDEVPGLQAQLGGSWQGVPPLPGTLIVNLGDVLEMLTNGIFRSTRHRVVNAAGRQRCSVAFFMDPDADAVVAPLRCCVSPGRPAAYAPTTAGAHLLAKLGASLGKGG